MATFIELAQSLYPNMPPDILELFASEWSKTGDPNVAISNVRRTTAYDIAFPGNKRPDGTVKFDEVTYTGLKESYIGTLSEFGIPRNTSVDLLTDRFTGLIEGEVSAREFAQRVGAVYEGVQENIPEVQSFYRENFGLELTPEAIFVGALDPSVGEEIVAGRITTAQIGGEAARAGFEISGDSPTVFYLDNDGQGNVRRYSFSGATRVYANETQGTIDYSTGAITINSLSVLSVENIRGAASTKIELTVVPQSNDVVPVRDQILEIDIANSSITVSADTFVGGSADAGVGYTTSSSY